MPEPPEPVVPASLDAALRACARGELPANVALAQAALAAATMDELDAALSGAIADLTLGGRATEADRLHRARSLWLEAPDAWRSIRSVAAAAGRRPGAAGAERAIAEWAACFDDAARLSPAAGVALYSLGREDLLAAATDEIVAFMRSRGLLARNGVAVEIGCGIGRLLRALAGERRFAIGVDISPGMLAEARRRCEDAPGIALVRGSGRDLAMIGDGRVDLVYAVDSFPYLVDAGGGVAARHIHEAARILGPGGALLILNYSYRGDLAADCTELAELAGDAGFVKIEHGTSPFAHWDGRAFLLRKARRFG